MKDAGQKKSSQMQVAVFPTWKPARALFQVARHLSMNVLWSENIP